MNKNNPLVVVPVFPCVYGRMVHSQEVVDDFVEMRTGEFYLLDSETDEDMLFVPLNKNLHEGTFFVLPKKEFKFNVFLKFEGSYKEVGED